VTISRDSIAGLLLLALAGGYYWLTRDIPSSSLSDEVGADGLPKVLAAALAVVAALIAGKGLLAKGRPVAGPLANDDEADEHAQLPRALGFVAIGIGYMAIAPMVGFAIGIAMLIIAVAVYEREALSLGLVAIAAAGGLGYWLVFVRFLGTEQPAAALLALLVKG
jgi:putative tricarboxylic transport membrane protein